MHQRVAIIAAMTSQTAFVTGSSQFEQSLDGPGRAAKHREIAGTLPQSHAPIGNPGAEKFTGYFATGKSRTKHRLPRSQGTRRLPVGTDIRSSAYAGSCRKLRRRSPGAGVSYQRPVRV